ncbi:MAG: hypothetical protein D6725_04745 [Planctomycetota bacterium]|nr:MAG: hypothetical protein D6725_04745 [Planctomycetota bacterium]
MDPKSSGERALRDLFAAIAEHTFQVDLGVADPRVLDYLIDLLVRFVRVDHIFRIRDATGRRLYEVAAMLMEAEERTANPKREIHRHIGDFILFWTGIYPEHVERMRRRSADVLIDYEKQGRTSYYIASTFVNEPYQKEAPILRRLSEQFDLFQYGLRCVRREMDRLPERLGPTDRDAHN